MMYDRDGFIIKVLGITLVVILAVIGVKNFKQSLATEAIASGVIEKRFAYERTNFDDVRLLTDNYTGEQYIIIENKYGWTGITHLEGAVSANE